MRGRELGKRGGRRQKASRMSVGMNEERLCVRVPFALRRFQYR